MLEHDDHRQIAQRLDLLHFQDEAPGMAFWHRRGFTVFHELESAVRRRLRQDGYDEVRTPQMMRKAIWETSGHWSNFSAGMFMFAEDEGGEPSAAVKPVSCPGHIQIYGRSAPSYRELPMRLAEFGVVHRNEPGGSLHGLFRLREFTQDDGHIFCTEGQIVDEVARFCASVTGFYRAFGFRKVEVVLSTRPEQRFGDNRVWDLAEASLSAAAQYAGLDYALAPGDGAFYGPKLEFVLSDRVGRKWQCGTIQLDFVLPERFGLEYVDAQNQRKRPVMLHRAMLGSLERFLGVLLEHHQGKLPAWLAPEQALVIPVGDAHRAYADELMRELSSVGVRVRVDARAESLARRIAEAHEVSLPWILVVGDREVSSQTVSVREEGEQLPMSRPDLVALLRRECTPPV
jgi:threonyl-tRNA synthetase